MLVISNIIIMLCISCCMLNLLNWIFKVFQLHKVMLRLMSSEVVSGSFFYRMTFIISKLLSSLKDWLSGTGKRVLRLHGRWACMSTDSREAGASVGDKQTHTNLSVTITITKHTEASLTNLSYRTAALAWAERTCPLCLRRVNFVLFKERRRL